MKELSVITFLEQAEYLPVIDVRSPKEYQLAHIPGAISLPLFDDNERAIVGITYKQEGQNAAIQKGLEIAGPKMAGFVSAAKNIAAQSSTGEVIVHCWRGGMRSKSMATLFNFSGIPASTLKGGYKAYRKTVQQIFSTPLPLMVVGGKTGSAKTAILHALQQQGEQIIDLEKLASHKGSAFGHLGETEQPGTEHFENVLFENIRKLDVNKTIWVEDESHLIGTVFIPEPFWLQMREAPVMYCDFPIEERIRYLVATYGSFDREAVLASVKRITKKLGGQHAKAAIEAYESGNLEKATEIVLVYYDKTYQFGLHKRKPETIYPVAMHNIAPLQNAATILDYAKKYVQQITQ